ncbi:hypothetical protein SBC1_44010 (plasmid) [Caballeronia sp. SBC1]|nr:hypothetical protein SBC2_43960 [Caballeronia sp. SBC2]QIN64361.1 hypothetical protein SBC1_44010 [Caballeronia sp. SBC1]
MRVRTNVAQGRNLPDAAEQLPIMPTVPFWIVQKPARKYVWNGKRGVLLPALHAAALRMQWLDILCGAP